MEHKSQPTPLPPFFIVGAPRSGTTLLSRILDGHSRIAVYHESHFYHLFQPDLHFYGDLNLLANLRRFIEDVRKVTRIQGVMSPPKIEEFLAILPERSCDGVFAAMLQLYARRQGKRLCGDKTPGNHSYLARIYEKFPGSKIIFVMRDPRDTILSIRKALGTSLKGAVWMWNEAFRSYRRFTHQVYLVRYEDLVGETRKTIEAVCSFLGEASESNMFRFFEHVPSKLVAVRHLRKLQKEVDADSVGNFRQMSFQEIQWIEAACGEGMEELGYPFTTGTPKAVFVSVPSKLEFLLDRLRYYGWNHNRWRRGWMRWRIALRLRAQYFFSFGAAARSN